VVGSNVSKFVSRDIHKNTAQGLLARVAWCFPIVLQRI